METETSKRTNIFADTEPLTDEQFTQLLRNVHQGEFQREQFSEYFHKMLQKQSDTISSNAVMSVKAAQGCYVLGDYSEAVIWLDKNQVGKDQSYLKGCCLRNMGKYKEAIDQFEKSQEKGYDSFDIAVAIVECLRRAGSLDEARDRLKRISRIGDIRAEYHFQLGMLHEADGLHEQAIMELERAVELDGKHSQALFHLAYVCDMYGDEESAIVYYKRCIGCGGSPVRALLNLAVIYEDIEDYHNAAQFVEQVLVAYPNHTRARMFLKDILSSETMYYDEEQALRVDRRNKVLEIPISDFELSVRSRNCLRRMNIRTLGDLLKVTESELLAYKNFGETSLHEVKTILTPRGLRLGQMLEEPQEESTEPTTKDEVTEKNSKALTLPVKELKMSVRARKCLERLNINIVEDITKCTEAELLGCKNFGMTSLEEIKKCLKEYGMSLRRLED